MPKGGEEMGLVLVILLVVLLIGAVPNWPHSRNWGYFPSGFLGLVLLVIIVLALVGRL
jgi:asparagine N-glycosylation enzyme membrane subunit Stt3